MKFEWEQKCDSWQGKNQKSGVTSILSYDSELCDKQYSKLPLIRSDPSPENVANETLDEILPAGIIRRDLSLRSKLKEKLYNKANTF